MPYYVHFESTSAEDLRAEVYREIVDSVHWPPDISAYRRQACSCDECLTVLWQNYWEGHPEIPRVRPTTSPLPNVLVLAIASSAAEAHETRKRLQEDVRLAVTFLPTAEERDNWRLRERRKLRGGSGCRALPWAEEEWQDTLNELHHAYLSVEKPGLIAYTPSEEYGVADRQIRVRPGRYLEQFAPHLSPTERDAYCAQIKAIDDKNVVQFATTAEEIVRVYRSGPDSCMSYDVSDYETDGVHPVSVYGESDLQLAYLAEPGHIRARVLVWPERKVYSRVYGDTTIKYLLAALGYESGSLAGARVRALRVDGDVFVMPYIDGIEYADKSGAWFYLKSEDDGGDYQTQNTNGTTNNSYEHRETPTCAHCSDADVRYEGDYCDSCLADQSTCVHCDESFFDDDAPSIDYYGTVCHYCYRRHARMCAHPDCDVVFMENQYSLTDRDQRDQHSLTKYCLDCGDDELEARTQAEEGRRKWAETLDALRISLMTRRFTSVTITYSEVAR